MSKRARARVHFNYNIIFLIRISVIGTRKITNIPRCTVSPSPLPSLLDIPLELLLGKESICSI